METHTIRVSANDVPTLRRFVYRLPEKAPDTLAVATWLDSRPPETTQEEILSGLFRFSPRQIEAAFNLDKPVSAYSEWVDFRIECEIDPRTFRCHCKVFADGSKCHGNPQNTKIVEFEVSCESWHSNQSQIIDHVVREIVKSASKRTAAHK